MPAVPDNGPYPKPFGQGHYPDAAVEYRYRNALLWIRTIAGLHYFGGAFNPEHMRALANLAALTLDGKDLPDFGVRMAEGKQRAREMADALGIELLGEDELAVAKQEER